MDATYALLAVVIALIGVAAKAISDVRKKCDKTTEGLIGVKAKLDILLHLGGLDPHKVNSSIKEHMDELKQDGAPSVGGCINVDELYRDKEKPSG
jgi:hypothetical protein